VDQLLLFLLFGIQLIILGSTESLSKMCSSDSWPNPFHCHSIFSIKSLVLPVKYLLEQQPKNILIIKYFCKEATQQQQNHTNNKATNNERRQTSRQ